MIPLKDSLLVGWSANADEKLTAAPTDYNCTAAQALQFHNLNVLWTDAYNAVIAAKASGSQTKPLTEAKATAKANFLKFAREIYAFVQNSLTVSDENKAELGVVVKKTTASPKPVLLDSPTMEVMGVFGRQFRLRITDGADTRRQRPFNANGVSLYWVAGDTAPAGTDGWVPAGVVTKSQVILEVPETIAPSTKIWLTCAYFNARGSGPACTPIFTYTNHQGAEPLSA
jgi:hypothetical protein